MIMNLIDSESVPWKDCQTNNSNLSTKKYFVEIDDEVKYKYQGVQKYLRKAYALGFKEDPNYLLFE